MTEEALDPFPGGERFYSYRGTTGTEDGAPLWVPIHQGDVFSGMDVPGLEQRPIDESPPADMDRLVMVFMHPCVMRRGSTLADRVTVFRVRLETRKAREYERFAGNFSVMPLPELLGAGSGVHFGEFQMIGTVMGAELDRAKRVMSLTSEGRLMLQQRAVHHFTRHAPPLHDLRKRMRRVERELGLLAQWCEAVCEARGETAEVVADAERLFEEFLQLEDRRRRLADDDVTHEVQTEFAREIRLTFRS